MISFAMPVIRQSEGARGDLHGRDLDEVLVVCIPQRELKEEGYGHQEKSYGLRASWQNPFSMSKILLQEETLRNQS